MRVYFVVAVDTYRRMQRIKSWQNDIDEKGEATTAARLHWLSRGLKIERRKGDGFKKDSPEYLTHCLPLIQNGRAISSRDNMTHEFFYDDRQPRVPARV